MNPWLDDGDLKIYVGDCRDVLKQLPEESVHCVVTSPPYFGLRDYGTATWEGGDPGCDHSPEKRGGRFATPVSSKQASNAGSGTITVTSWNCPCGATRVDNQIGLETTPDQYVEAMVDVFREVRRVLRQDGTCWLNLGDTYAANRSYQVTDSKNTDVGNTKASKVPSGLKPKDLIGIPWSVAKALQEPYYTGKIKDERDRVWLAAMIDAEGCMFIHRRKAGTPSYSKFRKKDGTDVEYKRTQDTFGVGLEVTSTDRAIVERCMVIAGIGSICEQGPNENHRRKQTLYRWNARTNECRDVIKELYPHFVAKQHEARLVLNCPSSGDDAKKAWESLKALHQGQEASIDFQPPEGMWERGWFLRSEIIWAKLDRTLCLNPQRIDRRSLTNIFSC